MLETLLQAINTQHGRAFEAGGRYPTGEQGAFAIVDWTDGLSQAFVLKWSPGTDPTELHRTATLTNRLRDAGYPAPRYHLIGSIPELDVVYSIQETLPGLPLGDRLEGQMLDQLVKLNALQCGQADMPSQDWPRAVIEPVLHGGNGFCLLEPMRSYSRQMADLLGEFQRLALADATEPGVVSDIVHFDFQGANILIDGDTVSGVVDWDGWCVGDAAFDLATLYFYTDPRHDPNQAQLARLWNLLIARLGPHLLGAYLAHLMLRQLDWSIRFHDREAVEMWLSRCHDMLLQLAAATNNDVNG